MGTNRQFRPVNKGAFQREADLPSVDSSLREIMLHKAELLRKAHRKAEAAKLERAPGDSRTKQRGSAPLDGRLPRIGKQAVITGH
jgi:hypothetical protein